jgi:hypothetical protein
MLKLHCTVERKGAIFEAACSCALCNTYLTPSIALLRVPLTPSMHYYYYYKLNAIVHTERRVTPSLLVIEVIHVTADAAAAW